MFLKAYGDTLNDGAVQLSFTLPVAESARAREAARQYALKLGFHDCEVVHSARLAENFTFFVVYGRTEAAVDFDAIEAVASPEGESLTMDGVNDLVREKLGRPAVVVGACTGSDAHTVGIDAIMNMKGYNHHFGLERYPMFRAHNLGAQVPNERLIEEAVRLEADAILVSQVVTQKDAHLRNLTRFVELIEAENLRERFVLIVGGPRISHKLAREMGFDAGFGKGTYAEHVGAFIARRLIEKKAVRNG